MKKGYVVNRMKKHLINLFVLSLVFSLCAVSVIAGPVKVACVGDSITAGVGAKNHGLQSYPAQLQAILGDKYEVKNCGTSGIMMSNYLPRWSATIEKFQPDIVTIKLGTNDTKGRRHSDPNNKAAFDKRYSEATFKVLAFLNGLDSKPEVYICLPVPVFQDKWGINEKSIVEDVIPALKSIAAEKKLPVIDLYKALEGKGAMVPDGVHPNEVAYKIIAEKIAEQITTKK